ncbi:hypothetical protein VP01_14467g1, partial [Puccinia sorghi]
KLGALIGDVVATHKVAGFSSHSAKRFCSWCDVLNTEIAQMQMGRSQTQMATLAAARKWTDATQTAQKKLVKQTGVQISELNRLTYWDPAKNVVLGIMHNWFEGVLQHHFQYRWGINGNIDKQTDSDAKESEAGTSDYLTEEVIDVERKTVSVGD